MNTDPISENPRSLCAMILREARRDRRSGAKFVPRSFFLGVRAALIPLNLWPQEWEDNFNEAITPLDLPSLIRLRRRQRAQLQAERARYAEEAMPFEDALELLEDR